MEMWTEVRRRVLTGELSKRGTCRQYVMNWRTLAKMLSRVEPPGYRPQAKREQPVLGPHLTWVHEVLEQDQQEPKKQRHTAKRIFDRLKVERGVTGGSTVVKDAVQKWKAMTKEVFVPLSHPLGDAQTDFGFVISNTLLPELERPASTVIVPALLPGASDPSTVSESVPCPRSRWRS